ncbi:MAG TPA: P-loop NTPase [Anaerolineales bacterium]|nr:P-loop NTPase [Anaerolineales bacterium]
MSDRGRSLSGRRIGVFGKGGAGKSTVVVLLAGALRERGYAVCVLDADSTNIGLPQAFGLSQSPVPLMEYFGGMVFSGGVVTCPVDDPTPLAGAEIALDDLPGQYLGRNREGITLLAAGKIADQGPGAGCDGPVAKIARDLRIDTHGEPPVTLVDFKAGFEDSARGVVTGLDWGIVVIDPTTASVEMAVHMKRMVKLIKAGALPATKHLDSPELVAWANKIFMSAAIQDVLFVLNRVRHEEMELYLRRKLSERDIEPIGVIYEDTAISAAWLTGAPIDAAKAKDEAGRIISELEAILEPR